VWNNQSLRTIGTDVISCDPTLVGTEF